MPTYSYRCTSCGVEFDVHQAFSDAALTTCEACGGALRKLFSPVGVTFSGSGFYRTDSRKESASTTSSSSDTSSASTPAASPAPSTSASPAPSTTTSAPSSASGQ